MAGGIFSDHTQKGCVPVDKEQRCCSTASRVQGPPFPPTQHDQAQNVSSVALESMVCGQMCRKQAVGAPEGVCFFLLCVSLNNRWVLLEISLAGSA